MADNNNEDLNDTDQLTHQSQDNRDANGDKVGYINTGTDDSTLGQTRYDFNYRTFPSDIGSGGSHHHHYMVININVRDTIVGGSGGTNFLDSINGPGGRVIKTFTLAPGGEMSKMDVLRQNLDPSYTSNAGVPLGIGNNSPYTLPRFTRRIVESIAIFMPQSLQFITRAEYEDISLLSLGTEIVSSGVNSGGHLSRGWQARPIGSGVAGTVAGAFTGILEKGGNLAQLAQTPLNPLTEILFRTTPQREFVFDFLMAPSNRKESEALDQIYKVLKFHQAPELTSYALPLFRSPSEFDITFFISGRENKNIPRINTCVLEQIDMDYNPTGVYSTFSNGAPVAARMTLKFRELEIITKLRVTQGF